VTAGITFGYLEHKEGASLLVVRRGLAMQVVSIAKIEEQLRRLPEEKLAVVYDFVSYLAEHRPASEALQTMLASEAVLARDWNRPEEDEAWADL